MSKSLLVSHEEVATGYLDGSRIFSLSEGEREINFQVAKSEDCHVIVVLREGSLDTRRFRGGKLLIQVDMVTDVEIDPSSGAIEISGLTGRGGCKVTIPSSALGEILRASIRAEESGYLLEGDYQVEMPMLVPESIMVEAAKDMGLVFRFHLHDGKQAAFIIPTSTQFGQLDNAARTVSEGIQMADDRVTARWDRESESASV